MSLIDPRRRTFSLQVDAVFQQRSFSGAACGFFSEGALYRKRITTKHYTGGGTVIVTETASVPGGDTFYDSSTGEPSDCELHTETEGSDGGGFFTGQEITYDDEVTHADFFAYADAQIEALEFVPITSSHLHLGGDTSYRGIIADGNDDGENFPGFGSERVVIINASFNSVSVVQTKIGFRKTGRNAPVTLFYDQVTSTPALDLEVFTETARDPQTIEMPCDTWNIEPFELPPSDDTLVEIQSARFKFPWL